MAIEFEGGHSRSTRTREEAIQLLERDLANLSPEEREVVETMIRNLTDPPEDEPDLLTTIGRLEWVRTPVDMKTFCMDPYYLGNTCDTIYNVWLNDLTELFEGSYREAVFTGAIGTGKTFAASVGICRLLYILSCMRDPHRSFGIASNSNISVVCLSVNEILATKVAYENIATKIEASPYFQEHFPFDKTKKELRFPRKIWVAARASNDGSVLGLNVIAGLLDECICPESLVFLANGETACVVDLPLDDSVQVVSFGGDGRRVHASAWVKKSGNQQCYELSLENGSTIRASWHHPILTRCGDVLDFKFLSDILLGEEVVVYASEGSEALRGSEEKDLGGREEEDGEEEPVLREEAFERGAGEDVRGSQGADRLGALRGYEAEDRGGSSRSREIRGAEGEAVGSDENSLGRGRVEPEVSAERLGRGQPVLREAAYRGCEAAYRGRESRTTTHGRGARKDVPRSVRAIGRESGGVSDGEGWRCGSERRSGATGSGVVGRGQLGGELRVRGTGCEVRDECWDKVDGSRLQGSTEVWTDQSDRGQVSGDTGERRGSSSRGIEILRRRRMGPRRLGRELSVARVVSKRDLGVQPTYDVSVPGYECFVADGALVHNTNFMPRATKNQDPRFNLQDRAEVLYNAMQRRMKSRFERKGQLPGILFVVSSKQTHDDFTARRINESIKDPTIFVRDYSLWETKPDAYYSGDWFHVVVGNEQAPSRIVRDDEDVEILKLSLPDDCVVIEAPEDFRIDFEKDLEGAIRDLAGVATVTVSPYIQRRAKIVEATRPDLQHPFSVEVYDPSMAGNFYWSKMVQFDPEEGVSRPILNPHAPRHIHIDPSSTGDATGFAMGHISSWRQVVRRDDEGGKYPETAPEITVDVLLKIIPPIGGEIVLGDVRKLVYQLSRHGYMITCVSIDSWNSVDAIQKLNQRGFNAIQLSVDRTMGPYELVKMALYEDRLYYYDYPPLLQELRELQRDFIKRKVDHPLKGCFVGSTRIPLLDGTHPMIGELSGREVLVASVRQDGSMVPGRARGRRTEPVCELVDVILDSGAVERCTPEHQWMLRDGSYKEAQHLRPADCLMLVSHWDGPEIGGHHKVRAVIPVHLATPVPMYDLEVDEYSNFALCSGVLVHNSKDVSDALAGIVATLTENSSNLPIGFMKSVPRGGDVWMAEHEQAALARRFGSEDAPDMSPDPITGLGMLPPFLTGSDD